MLPFSALPLLVWLPRNKLIETRDSMRVSRGDRGLRPAGCILPAASSNGELVAELAGIVLVLRSYSGLSSHRPELHTARVVIWHCR